MIPAPHYHHLHAMLNSGGAEFGIHHVPAIPDETSLLGFVFFSQNYERDPTKDFIKNINILNSHSAEHIHFLLPGISAYGPNEGDDSSKLGTLSEAPLYYNPRAFFSFKEEFERKIDGWSFDYGMDLVLANFNGNSPHREIDLRNALFFKIDELIRAEICDSTRVCLQLSRIITEASCTPARKFLASLS